MRKTVRTSIATAAAVALLALTACGSATESAAPAADGPYAAPAKDITATISVSNWGDPGDKAVYDGVAERFKEKYPNVTVNNNFTPITTWTEYVNKLVTQAAAGQAPDVINIATEGVELGLANELFTPLDGFLKNDPEASVPAQGHRPEAARRVQQGRLHLPDAQHVQHHGDLLQHQDVRGRRHRTAQRRLDLGRVPGDLQEADHGLGREQGLRVRHAVLLLRHHPVAVLQRHVHDER